MASIRSAWCAILLAASAVVMPVHADPVAAPAIPFKHTAQLPESDPVRVLAALAACIGVLGVALFVLRRRIGTRSFAPAGKHVTVLDKQRLTPASTLYVVEFGQRKHLLASSEHGWTCIASTPSDADTLETP